jgi:hypothetical protein
MGFLYALWADAGLLGPAPAPTFCASNIEPGLLFCRNGVPRSDDSPYTRAFAAQLGHTIGDAGLPYTLFFASRVKHGNVAIEALEHALARLAAEMQDNDDLDTETGVCELFKATARHLGLPEPVRELPTAKTKHENHENPYFDADNWRQRAADRDDQLRRQGD